LCMRVYRDGSLEPDLAYNAVYLQSLSTKLVESFRAAQTPNQLSKDQYGLQDIASKLLKTTNQLNQLVEDYDRLSEYAELWNLSISMVCYLSGFCGKTKAYQSS
jgi:hypothetical protein